MTDTLLNLEIAKIEKTIGQKNFAKVLIDSGAAFSSEESAARYIRLLKQGKVSNTKYRDIINDLYEKMPKTRKLSKNKYFERFEKREKKIHFKKYNEHKVAVKMGRQQKTNKIELNYFIVPEQYINSTADFVKILDEGNKQVLSRIKRNFRMAQLRIIGLVGGQIRVLFQTAFLTNFNYMPSIQHKQFSDYYKGQSTIAKFFQINLYN
jgi:phosphoglucomutase